MNSRSMVYLTQYALNKGHYNTLLGVRGKLIINRPTCCGQSQATKWAIIIRVVEKVIKVA